MGLWAIASSLGVTLGAFALYIVRHYKKDTLDSFLQIASYIYGSVRLRVAKRISAAAAGRLGLRRYARIMLDSGFPDFLLIPSATDIRLRIDDVYVRLQLYRGTGQIIGDGELVTRYQRSVLVFGEAGSGKTSLMRKSFRDICSAALAKAGTNRLPIHIELRTVDWRECPDDRGEAGAWLMGLLRDRFRDIKGVNDPDFLFDSFSETWGLVVFLDGLDEIPASDSENAFSAIQGLQARVLQLSPNSCVITTARSQLREVMTRTFLESFGNIYSLKSFSMTDIYSFLQRWPYTNARKGDASRIYTDIQRQPTLAEMCGNPLVLSMYVARDQLFASSESGRPVRLPDTRAEFYSDIVNELILFRRETQVGRVAIGGQTRRTRQEILGRIALNHLVRFSEPANSIPWRGAAAIAATVLGRSTDDAERELRELAISTGLFLEERREESIRFLHLTICEYLAAYELAQAPQEEFLDVLNSSIGYGRHDYTPTKQRRLWETLCFCVASLPRDKRAAALLCLQDADMPCELLLRAIRECQTYENPVFVTAINSMRRELRRTGPEEWADDWFGKLQLAISCLLDAERVAHIRAMPTIPTPSQFLDHIVCGDPVRFDQIYDMYLRTSPSEALEVARNYQHRFDILSVARLAKAMEEPEIVTVGLSRADSFCDHEPESLAWTLALAEAALRHDLVAETLVNQPVTECLIASAWRVPDRFQWHRLDFLNGTALGAILSIAAHHVGSSSGGWKLDLRRVGLLSEVDVAEVRDTSRRARATRDRRLRSLRQRSLRTSAATWSLQSTIPHDDVLAARVILRLAPRTASARLRGDFALAQLGEDLIGLGKLGLSASCRTKVSLDGDTIRFAHLRLDGSAGSADSRPQDFTFRAVLDDLTVFTPLQQVFLLIDEIETYEQRPLDIEQR